MRKNNYGLFIMSFLYITAGIIHLVNPGFYLRIIPLWMPWHVMLVFLSGITEIALGVLLLFKRTRRVSAWLIISMLVVYFFMIHISMAVDYQQSQNPYRWVTWVRLPLQFLLIAWAYRYTRDNPRSLSEYR